VQLRKHLREQYMHADILASSLRDTILSMKRGGIQNLFVKLGIDGAFNSSMLAYNITDTSHNVTQNALGALSTQYWP
jgi:hypothetical protein